MKKSIDEIELDVHTHTIASGHAFSTINEMVVAAKEKKLKLLGITEHGPIIEGSPNELYYRSLSAVPPIVSGIDLMLGCEMNIINDNNKIALDFFEKLYDSLALRLAGVHVHFVQGDRKYNNKVFTEIMSTGLVDIISHPDREIDDLDFELLFREAIKYNVLIEVNNASLKLNEKHALPRIKKILQSSKKFDYPILVSSDAHYDQYVRNYNRVWKVMDDIDFPDDLIINFSKKDFLKKIQKNHKVKKTK